MDMEIKVNDRGHASHSKGLVKFKEYLESITSDTIREIHIDMQHGKPEEIDEPSTGNIMKIIVFSVPVDVKDRFYEGILETIELDDTLKIMDCQSDAFIYHQRNPLIDYDMILDKRGQTIALVKDNLLWIVFDLVHEDNVIEEITQYIIKEAFGLIGRAISPEEKAKREMRQLEALYRKFIEREAINIDDTYRLQERKVSQLAKDLASAMRQLHRISLERESLKKDIEGKVKNVHKMIEGIVKNKKIRRVRVVADTLCVDTNDIYLGAFNIGRYRIFLPNIGLPRVEKLDKVIRGYKHPHATESGELCYGGFKDGVNALNRARWDEAIVTVLSVLEAYDSESCYVSLEPFLEKNYPEIMKEVYPKYVPHGKKVWKIIGGRMTFRDKE